MNEKNEDKNSNSYKNLVKMYDPMTDDVNGLAKMLLEILKAPANTSSKIEQMDKKLTAANLDAHVNPALKKSPELIDEAEFKHLNTPALMRP